jgi:hypothetical protein
MNFCRYIFRSLYVSLVDLPSKRTHGALECVHALDISSRKVVVEVFMDIQSGVLDRIPQHSHVIRRRLVTLGRFQPGVSSRITIAGSSDELLGTCSSDGIDGGLVVLEDQGSRHIMGFIHQAVTAKLESQIIDWVGLGTSSSDSHDVRVALETFRHLSPESSKLSSSRCLGV